MQRRKLKHYLIITLKGIAMGAADVVPGVSGGTIAFISGIYEELLTSISSINLQTLKKLKVDGFKEFWKSINGNFLLALLSGILISVVSLAKLISWLLEHKPVLVWAFFFGLVLASILFVGKQISKWNISVFINLLAGASIAFYITTLQPLITENSSPLFLFLAGALAICAMILPGISGAFILVLLGAYKPVLDAVHNKDVKLLSIIAAGAIVGLLTFSNILKWLFVHYKNSTLAVLTGFILGSLNKIWPWKNVVQTKLFGDKLVVIKEISVLPNAYNGNSQLFLAILLAILGFIIIIGLEKAANFSSKE
jgi:putative membrane protein